MAEVKELNLPHEESLLHCMVPMARMYQISFFGEGHTPDNVVAYLPTDQTLFGGCLIKSLGAGKGNLEDANVQDWSSTVTKIKKSYPNVRIVIPGHGNPGSQDLLDYTIEMFSEN